LQQVWAGPSICDLAEDQMKIAYHPMSTAPKNRSVIAKTRDNREVMVKWEKRSGPPRNSYLGTREPGMVEGWCERESAYPLGVSDLFGWREAEEF
jgi:hypothetical protein